MGDKTVGVKSLIDTGADAVIINTRLVDQYKLPTVRLPRALTFRNADDSINKKGMITHRIEGHLQIKHLELPTRWYVADLGQDDIILGMPWIRRYNPKIDWQNGQIRFDRKTIQRQQRIHKYQQMHQPPEGTLWGLPVPTTTQDAVLSFIESSSEDIDEDQLTHDPSKVIKHLWDNSTRVRKMNKSTEIAIAANQGKKDIPLEELVPTYAQDFREVFEKKASDKFPPSRSYDHEIKIDPAKSPQNKRWGKIYPLTLMEQDELRKFIDENLAKGFIRRSDSPYASPFFFVSKKDGKLRPVQDYRALNDLTIKDAYPLPLIESLTNQLGDAFIFTKFDVRAGYNNVRIKDGDQHKAAFTTPLGLYEPMVMFFGLCNAPATFQRMMDEIFADLTREGWIIIYMDDILIFSNNLEEHRKRTRRVLQRLQDHALHLKPEKCLFEVAEVEFLGAIISAGKISMDPVKLKAIHEWPAPTTVKQTQSFLGFGNFYRRFIRDYSTIVRPLTELTKKDKPWEWTTACQHAFDELKNRFTKEPILKIPNPHEPFQLECDASGVATGAVLRQQGSDGIWHPCAYLSKMFYQAERNYQIYK